MGISEYLLYQTRVIDVIGGPVPNFSPQHLKNKVVVITGANTGILARKLHVNWRKWEPQSSWYGVS
jgi:hypothetical protein